MSRIILGITGLIGSGKDSAAQYLIDNYNFTKLSFAGSLKDAVSVVFGWDRELLEGTTKESREWREQVDEWWATRLDMPHLTPRWVLQHWGTELFRQSFHNDIWVLSLENKLRQQSGNVVITDCRFKNEINAIKNVGGRTARIFRGMSPDWYPYAESFNKFGDTLSLDVLKRNNVHASEYSSVGLDYDHLISNNSSLEDLHSKLDLIIDL
jgi:hypothetical protein